MSNPFVNPACLNDALPCAPNGDGGCVACTRFGVPSQADKDEINALINTLLTAPGEIVYRFITTPPPTPKGPRETWPRFYNDASRCWRCHLRHCICIE